MLEEIVQRALQPGLFDQLVWAVHTMPLWAQILVLGGTAAAGIGALWVVSELLGPFPAVFEAGTVVIWLLGMIVFLGGMSEPGYSPFGQLSEYVQTRQLARFVDACPESPRVRPADMTSPETRWLHVQCEIRRTVVLGDSLSRQRTFKVPMETAAALDSLARAADTRTAFRNLGDRLPSDGRADTP